MLVLSRKAGETIKIGGNITIKVIEVRGNRMRIGIEAPDNLTILRGELDGHLPQSAGAGSKVSPLDHFELVGWTEDVGREAQRHMASHTAK